MISVCDMTVYSSQHFFFNVFVFYSLTTVIPDSILKLAPYCAGPPQWEWESEHTLFLVTRVEGKSAVNKYVRKKTAASKMAAIPSHPPFSWAGRRTAEWEGNRPGFDWYFKYVKYFSCAWYFQAQWESPKSAKLPHLALQTGWNKCSKYLEENKYYLNTLTLSLLKFDLHALISCEGKHCTAITHFYTAHNLLQVSHFT